MKPSFSTLFKRGRYFRVPVSAIEDSSEIVRGRIEAERFSAAAVGFCLTHCVKFRNAFLSNILECNAPLKRVNIDVEPEHWADLMITVGASSVCVIEFKISAPLQAWQNPCAKEFWECPSGYGYRFEEAFPRTQKRYLVLGATDHLWNLPQREGWTFDAYGWDSVAKALERAGPNTILEDLKTCLANFGIWEFSSTITRDMNMTCNALSASATWQVLWDAYSYPDLKLSSGATAWRCDTHWSDRENWYFGIELKTNAHEILTKAIRPSAGAAVVWFGYEPEKREAKRSMWLYCQDDETAQWFRNAISPSKTSRHRLLTNASEPNHVGVTLRSTVGSGSDQSHFIGLLQMAIGLSMHRNDVTCPSEEEN